MKRTRRVRVLVVDDSAFARKVLREILGRSEDLEVVGAARDGLDALEKIATLRPDVVTLDLVMPHLDGLGVLAALPKVDPPRVVVVSTAGDDSASVVAALQAGAITAVTKPTALASERLYDMADRVIAAVLRAAAARRIDTTERPIEPAPPAPVATRTRLVVVGASTGGPQALTRLLQGLPGSFPVPIAIVLHMPVGYTEALARRLDELCAIGVHEASDGLELRPGHAVVARAGLHLVIDERSGGRFVRLEPMPLDLPHRPSVDVLFASAARAVGAGVLGVVMTGMGDDGLVGSRAVVEAGGRVITQGERSCVVYGMPRAVAEAGLSTAAVDLDGLAAEIVRRL